MKVQFKDRMKGDFWEEGDVLMWRKGTSRGGVRDGLTTQQFYCLTGSSA